MKYKFSPIKTKEELLEVISYIAQETTSLCSKIIGQELPIGGLTVFSHYQDEFKELKKIALDMGKLDSENNGPYIKLDQPIELPNSQLELLRIRKPDPYRLHVGCNDFKVPNYKKFKRQHLKANPYNLRLFKRPEYEMIEFFDPDYDVLAYVASD